MPNNLPGHDTPAVGFEAPLEMLSACHHRIERQCETLRRLVAHLANHGPDADARAAATAVMRYFDTAARDHHADEERDLFPALRESMAGSDAVCIRQMIDSLALEHRSLESQWASLRPVLVLIEGGLSSSLPAADVERFVDDHEAHIAREESELLPMAARLLDDAALTSIGRAMRERRGIASID